MPNRKARLIWLLFGPMLIFICFFFIFPAMISLSWHWHPSSMLGIVLPMFNYNLLGGPLFEEFGWRGFLQLRLQFSLPPWLAAICVGAMWAAWHWPLFLLHDWTNASPLAFGFILIGLSILLAFAFNASGQCIVVAILMHSAFNASPRFLNGYLGGVQTRQHPSPEFLLACSFLLLGTVLIASTRGRLRARRKV